MRDRRVPHFVPNSPKSKGAPRAELPLFPSLSRQESNLSQSSSSSSLCENSPSSLRACDLEHPPVFTFDDEGSSPSPPLSCAISDSPATQGGESIEFIQGDNCSRSVGQGEKAESDKVSDFVREVEERFNSLVDEGRLFLSEKEKEAILKVAKQGALYGLTVGRLERALLRLRRRKSCGQHGHLLVGVRDGEIVEFKRANHSCRSVHCPYCQVRESRKRLAKLMEWFLDRVYSGKTLSFITITVKNSHNIFEVVNRINVGFRKLYQFRIFGKRNWAELRREFAKECLNYYRNLLGQGKSRSEARKKVQFQIKIFREFEKLREVHGTNVKFNDLFEAVWKFELTYSSDSGFHPHWHGITTLLIPKLLLTVLMRRVGLGEVCDIRAVSSREAIVELSKYTNKYWELEGADFETLLAVESALIGFQKLRVWGVPEMEGEGDGVRYFGLPNVSVQWREEKSFIETFKELHRERKSKTVRLHLSSDSYVSGVLGGYGLDVRSNSFFVEGVMDEDGEIVIPLDAISPNDLGLFFRDFDLFVESQVKDRDRWELFLMETGELRKAILRFSDRVREDEEADELAELIDF